MIETVDEVDLKYALVLLKVTVGEAHTCDLNHELEPLNLHSDLTLEMDPIQS